MLKFKVAENKLTRSDAHIIDPATDIGLACEFEFSDDLAEYVKFAVFSAANTTPVISKISDSNTVTVPQQFIGYDIRLAVKVEMKLNNHEIITNYDFVNSKPGDSTQFKLPLYWDMKSKYQSKIVSVVDFERIFGSTEVTLIQPEIYGKKTVRISTDIDTRPIHFGRNVYISKEGSHLNVRIENEPKRECREFSFVLEKYSEIYGAPYITMLGGGDEDYVTQTQLQAITDGYDEDISDIDAEIEGLENNLTNLNEFAAQVTSDLTELNDKVEEDIDPELTNLSGRMTVVESDVNSLVGNATVRDSVNDDDLYIDGIYMLGELGQLHLRLYTPTDLTHIHEITFTFGSGDTATSVIYDGSLVQFPNGTNIEANKRYEINLQYQKSTKNSSWSWYGICIGGEADE